MNYIVGKNYLKEILATISREDEKNYLLDLEYVKHYKGVVLGPIHKDGYGNWVTVFKTKSVTPNLSEDGTSDDYTWNSFKEAKKKREKCENSSSRVFHVKKGLKIAFKHVMYLDGDMLDEIKPHWYSLYGEWFKSRGEYTQAHKNEWEKQEDKMRPIGVLNASELFER